MGLLLAFTLLVGLYAWLRYGGAYGHGDTSAAAVAIARILDSGDLVPQAGAYPNGYGYQALVVHLTAVTGLSPGILQSLGAVLLAFWVVLPAWLAYREFTRSEAAASLATLILLVQPEFLFPLLRGTHEKFTRGLMFLLLFLLLRSLRAKDMRRVIGLVAAFYLAGYALIALNSFFANSFMVAIGLALLLIWALAGRAALAADRHPYMLRRLGLIILSLLVLAFLFAFYAYPPAQQQLRVMQSTVDRLAAVFLQVEEQPFNPYASILQGWTSLPVYLLVSLANWLLLAGSALIWLWQSWRFLVRRARPGRPALLLWAFYGAFAFQSAVSILVDLSGAIAGNMQHRIFPSFAMLAAPLVAGWLVPYRRRLAASGRRWLDGATAAILGALLLLSVIKATSEPLLSNYWTFYTASEHQAVGWAEQKLADRSLWVGFNDRVSTGYQISQDGRALALHLDRTLDVSDATRDFLVSQATLLHGTRLSFPLPSALTLEREAFVTYDNGQAQILHVRPKSPFQR